LFTKLHSASGARHSVQCPHPAQLARRQPPHEAPDEASDFPAEPLLMPKTENCRSVLRLRHFGHAGGLTASLERNNSSNCFPQARHWNS